jgi:hypothetical protein
MDPPNERMFNFQKLSVGLNFDSYTATVLSRVQSFLPQFATSTEEITRRAMVDPDSVDIEKLGNEGRYIRMVRLLDRSPALHLPWRWVGPWTWGL